MKYSILHRTIYTYASPVVDSYNDAHLCPVSDDRQCCESFALEIDPGNPPVLKRLDFYTNQVHHFELVTAHEKLEVAARSVVETYEDERDLDAPCSLNQLDGLGMDERFYDFVNPSERITILPMMIHEARELAKRSACLQETIAEVLKFIAEGFTYTPGATNVETPGEEVFWHRKGVCQDFAHVMIALCRSMKIPTRYVSGYFYSEKATKGTVDDNTESHAWVECYLPEIGWVGYDPTHNRRVDLHYIKVASGRDYADVRPLSGTFRGESAAELRVEVEVERLD
ncbi:MAG: transglutaminase family protein [Verrucomicrobiota bacterium]